MSIEKKDLNPEKFFWLVALTLVVFFARIFLKGLQPDAALYAGLSLKVLNTGEAWMLSGTQVFKQFAEHPPYFFQWGAWVLSVLGTSDAAARAIGALPASLSFLTLLVWLAKRFSWPLACATGLCLGALPLYSKYAATSMMEAPLSAAVIFAAIASYELHWRERIGVTRLIWTAVLWAAFAWATASKGVAGLGVWGGALMSVTCALLFSRRNAGRLGFSFALTLAAVNFALAPMFFWAYKIWARGDSMSLVFQYFKDQVLNSFLTNRGESLHPEFGDRLFYIKLLAAQAGPYFFGFVVAFLVYLVASMLGKPTRFSGQMSYASRRSWAWVAFSYVVAFVVPFSLSTFQLNHYVQPILPLMVSVAVAFYLIWLPDFVSDFLFNRATLRWSLVIVAGCGLFWFNQGISKTAQRGQEFLAVQSQILGLDPACTVLVSSEDVDPYKMECYSLWYFKGRNYEFVASKPRDLQTIGTNRVYWDLSQKTVWGRGRCQSLK